MKKPLGEEVKIAASLAEVWGFYFEPRTWPGWVDGFKAVVSNDAYPLAGATLVWRSPPNGRGQVTERVIEHQPRRLHRIRFSDQHSEGELVTTFEMAGEGVIVRQEATYGLMAPGLFGPATDRFFVRPQIRRSLERSLQKLKLEVEEIAGLASG